MPSCGAPGCKNRSNIETNKSFHRLPCQSKSKLRDAWLSKIKRKIVPKEMYICSDHFEDECFERDLKVWILIFRNFNVNFNKCKSCSNHLKPVG